MPNQNFAAKLFGIFFILTFLSYGIGTALVDASVNNFGLVDRTSLIAGVILMSVLHTVFNVALAAIMFCFLTVTNRIAATAYFGLAIIGTATLVIGTVFLLLAQNASEVPDAQSFMLIAKQGGFYSYQLGMAIWGFGGLILVALLYQSNLVPRILPVFGAVGYGIFIIGTIAEIAGYGIGTALSLPGGLFEIALSLWLIFKGVNVDALQSSKTFEKATI